MNLLTHYFRPSGPGAALGVAADGQAVHSECCGLADLAAGMAITPDTSFDLASGSKLFTAAAVMLLIERGALELTAPAGDSLPQLANTGAARPITVRDLLSHTSGLADYLEAGMYTPPAEMTAAFIDQHLHDWACQAQPGQQHAYSNTNYVVLAWLLEAVAGCAFAEFIEAQLIAPLGLRHTFVAGGQRPAVQVAKGYQNFGYGLALHEPAEELAPGTVGDGGIFSSLRDLLQWQAAFWRGDIVSGESLRQMQAEGQLDSGERFAYGLGLQLERRGNGQAWCGHGGSWTGSTVLIGRYLQEKVSVIVLSNEFMAPVERISQRALGGLAITGPGHAESR